MFNKLLFNNKVYQFSTETLNNLYNHMLRNDVLNENEYERRFVLSFLSNSVIQKTYEELEFHEFLLDGNFRYSKLICNISNVFGADKAKKYATKLSENLNLNLKKIYLDYFDTINTTEASNIWKYLFGSDVDFEKFKSLLALMALYEMADFDWQQLQTDYKELGKVTFLNGLGVKQVHISGKVLLKPISNLYDTQLDDYLKIGEVWIPPTLLFVMFKSNLNCKITGTFDGTKIEKSFLYKYEQLSGMTLSIEEEVDYSKWELDPNLYGIWYSIYKSTRPILGTDYNLRIESYNEDGTQFSYIKLCARDPNFSKDFNWDDYVLKWKSFNGELVIIDDDLDTKNRYKYEFKDGNLIIGDNVYYRSLEEAIEAVKKE